MPSVSAPASRTIELPSEGEMEAQLRRWTGEAAPWPVGYREWCKVVKVPARGRGMVAWKPERWHGVLDGAIKAQKDVFCLKEKGIRWTTDHILRCLWLGMLTENATGIYLTVNEDEAFKNPDSFKERMRLVYYQLPEWLRWLSPLVECPEGSFGTMGDLVWDHSRWAQLGESRSWLMVRPATQNAGAAGRYTDCVLDEMERYEDPDATLSGVMAGTHETGGHVIAGSTLTVNSSMSSRLWQEYVLGQVEPATIGGPVADQPQAGLFFGWGSLDGQTEEAYAVMEAKAKLRGAQGLLELHRLYPRTPEEAMSAFGKGLATPEALRECHEERPNLPVPEGLRKWELV